MYANDPGNDEMLALIQNEPVMEAGKGKGMNRLVDRLKNAHIEDSGGTVVHMGTLNESDHESAPKEDPEKSEPKENSE